MDVLEIISSSLLSTGNTWVSEESLKSLCFKYKVDTSSLPLLQKNNKIKVFAHEGKYFFSFPSVAHNESQIANEALRLLNSNHKKIPVSIIYRYVSDAEKEYGVSLDEEQKKAVLTAVNNPISIITGGPGTGKTMVIKIIAYVLKRCNRYEKIAFTAPTGRAASRITESTGFYAETLNKKLRIYEENMEPTPIEEDTLFVDEVSMLDVFLAASLLKAVKNGKRIILVGDIAQLPSVGVGSVLRDMLESEVIPSVNLVKTFRQDNGSVVYQNIQLIKKGCKDLIEGPDFVLAEAKKDVISQIVDTYLKEVKEYGIEHVVCLSPYRKAGKVNSIVINNEIQKKINPLRNDYCEYEGMRFQDKDPVIQLKNRNECANGDIGVVVKSNRDGIFVMFGKQEVYYKQRQLGQLSLAYAISVHKSQGSEYKSVITVLLDEHKSFLYRNVYYTAVTRARAKSTTIKNQNALEQAIENIEPTKRLTKLKEKLIYLNNKYLRVYEKAS